MAKEAKERIGLMALIKRGVLKIDRFGKQVRLNADGKYVIQSWPGSVLSMFIIIIIIFYA